mgnify:FL=1|tara:strand:- start:24 stop:377 length:354 start_codon:yes stop_codon:yes gene_type:complete
MSRASDLGRLEGVSKSWWQYDQVNTTTDGSFNVSSISDDSTGIYTPTLTAAQVNITDRCVVLTSNHDTGENYARISALRHDKGGTYSTTAISVEVFYASFVLNDNRHNFGTVFGDLA